MVTLKKEETLLGVGRIAWMRITQSEQRVSYLNKMLKKNRCVRVIEEYIKFKHEKLKSEQFKLREKDRDIYET